MLALVVSVLLTGCQTGPSTSSAKAAARPLRLAGRVSCSSLTQYKQPVETALKNIAGIGYEWVDLSCLNWAPHAEVPKLLENFEQEARRVQSALKSSGLRVSNLTFDAFDGRPFEQYEREFKAVLKLAVRLDGRLINIMAPSNKADRQEVAAKLKRLQALAAEWGIVLTLETHCNQITERPAEALWLCQQVPGLGLTLDPSHYYAGPNQGADFDALLPYVKGTGFRAGGMSWAEIQMPWGTGPIDFAGLARKLEASGYRGFYVSEYIEAFNQLDAMVEAGKFLAWARRL
jgi:sugar phosphate isomerase/epimerase